MGRHVACIFCLFLRLGTQVQVPWAGPCGAQTRSATLGTDLCHLPMPSAAPFGPEPLLGRVQSETQTCPAGGVGQWQHLLEGEGQGQPPQWSVGSPPLQAARTWSLWDTMLLSTYYEGRPINFASRVIFFVALHICG